VKPWIVESIEQTMFPQVLEDIKEWISKTALNQYEFLEFNE
jgi:hypothetical protein